MPVIAAVETASASRRRASSNGADFWFTSFMGGNRYRPATKPPPGPDVVYPVAFLVEQDPDVTVGAHFHQADQFQVVVHGAGRLGTHEVGPISVHFSAAFSPYGPIRAGSSGLHYFTLRNGWDPGARYMPGARAELPRPRHHRTAIADLSPATAETGRAAILAPEPDGLAAWRWRLAEGTRLDGPEPTSGRGQFWLVLAGTLLHDEAIGPRSCVFVYPDEPAFHGLAGAGGLDILALQFPLRLH